MLVLVIRYSMDKIIRQVMQKNKIDVGVSIKECNDGCINNVFQIGENYILKIQKELGVLLHQPFIVQLGLDRGAKVPRTIDYGEIDSRQYLLTEKMPGKKLSCDWLFFSEIQKENFIIQIVEQLKILHSIRFDKYSPQRPHEFDNFKDAIAFITTSINGFDSVDTKKLDKQTGENFKFIKQYYQNNLDILDEVETAVFVHNDLHFENILYQGDEITALIDFDFARQAPKDYELWHLVDFFREPVYYVAKELEPMWRRYNIGNEIRYFKKHYPELFAYKDLLSRLRLYMVDQMIDDIKYPAIDKFNKKVEDYFKNGWLERLLI